MVEKMKKRDWLYLSSASVLLLAAAASPVMVSAETAAESAVVETSQEVVPAEAASTPLEAITLSNEDVVLNVEGAQLLQVLFTPAEAAAAEEVIWTSSDESVAQVHGNGNVVGVAPGEAVITATVGDLTAEASVLVMALYSDYPVAYAWDFGVWSHYEGGSKVASSFNDFAGKQLDIIMEAKDRNGHTWVKFQIDGQTVGWVSKTGLKSQLPAYEVLYQDAPVANAWDFGVWTNYQNGTRLSGSLNNYRGKQLFILAEASDASGNPWVKFLVDDRVVGWVSALGLQGYVPDVEVLYTDRAVANAWDYGVWTDHTNGTKVAGSLNNYAGKELAIIAEAADAKGQPWVQFQVGGQTIGWVSARGLMSYVAPVEVLYTDYPVANAWDFGVWSHYENGVKVAGSLNDFAGQKLLVIAEASDAKGNPWVQFQVDGQTIGWVSKLGTESGKPEEPAEPKTDHFYYSVLAVDDAWNYGVWTAYEGGSKVGSMNTYTGRRIDVIKEAYVGPNNIWVQFEVGGEVIGWVSKKAVTVANPNVYVLYTRQPVANAWDFGVWTHYQNGQKVHSLSHYAGKNLNIIEEATHNGVKWVKFEQYGKTVGWVARAGLEK